MVQHGTPSRDDNDIEVSVVIPCLNEARSISICVDKAMQAFADQKIRGEVVVADNGSTDGSQELARERGARVVPCALRGYGHALRAGIEAARGTFIVMGDADDSYDFLELGRFVSKWREGYEVVMGNRFKGEIKPGAMPWHHRLIGNPALSGILNLLFRSPVGDAHCGLRGFTKEVYLRMDLRTTGMEFASEFVIKATKLGVQMTEIPVVLWPDKRGRPPHLRSFRDGWRHLRFMLLLAPNWLFLLPGTLLTAIGVALVLWLWPGPRTLGTVTLDVHTMLFGMVFALVGGQIIATGMYAKVFSHVERFSQGERSLERWLGRIKLEHGLTLGAILGMSGTIGLLRLMWMWAAGGFENFDQVRDTILWALVFFGGVQIVFSSFFLSMLGISRDTYIGDYQKRD